MNRVPSPDDLWNPATPADRSFDPARTAELPEPARRYLHHAIAPATPLASAVRLCMRGEIKLGGWHRFTAEEVIRWNRGMIWRASVRMHYLPIRGGDCFIDGKGAMRWKLFGLISLVSASGPDISRSAAGRVNIESVWMPSVLCADTVSWSASDRSHPRARFTAHGETAELELTIDEAGRLMAVSMPRWGNPGGTGFGYFKFGAIVEEESTFAGCTIPVRLRVGWHFGTPKFESEGEFFRVSIDRADYR